MKRLCLIFLLIVAAFLPISLVAQTQTKALSAGESSADGVVYALPKTELRIEAKAQLTIEKVGPFCKYAERFLGVKNPIVADARCWKLTDLQLETALVPDENKRFAVAVNKKTTAYNLSLAENGTILAINRVVDNVFTVESELKKVNPQIAELTFDWSQLGEETLVASSLPKMAEMAAKQIYHIRESRLNLLSGENEQLPDGTAMQTMLARLDSVERELVALFVGKRQVYDFTKVYKLSPSKVAANEILFRFSQHEGFVAIDNLIGEPIYLTIEAKLPKKTLQNQSNGIFYNVPTAANVKIFGAEKLFVEQTEIFPQFGTVQLLPAAFFDGKRTQVVFTKYGEIKSISDNN